MKSFNLSQRLYSRPEGSLIKIVILLALPTLKKVIKNFNPDILHAHYATSYGALAALTRFHPFIISVYGNDIYEFPKKSWLHRQLLKYNFLKADKILSTSHVMARHTAKFTDKKIAITPFGIDTTIFKPESKTVTDDRIYIGTVKTLEEKYGIKYLIEAFKIITDKHPDLPLRLLIVGGGSQANMLKNLAQKLQIQDKIDFTGRINYDDVVLYHNKLTIAVFPSTIDSESFGVAVLEASACGKPVIVSNVGGLPEVVINGETGIIVEPKNPELLAIEIEKLILNEELRNNMGKKGREFVQKQYSLADNVERMLTIYKEILKTP